MFENIKRFLHLGQRRTGITDELTEKNYPREILNLLKKSGDVDGINANDAGLSSVAQGKSTETPNQDNLSEHSNLLKNQLITVSMASNKAVLVQICAFLSMLRFSMEKSAKDGKPVQIKIVIRNSNNSDIMFGIGSDSLEGVAPSDEYQIGF
jgi:hypothetical protein